MRSIINAGLKVKKMIVKYKSLTVGISTTHSYVFIFMTIREFA